MMVAGTQLLDTLDESSANKMKLTLLERALGELLGEALHRGFHGTAGIEVSIQDGTIQHIRRKLERIER